MNSSIVQYFYHSHRYFQPITKSFVCLFAFLVFSTACYSSERNKLAYGHDIDDERVAEIFVAMVFMYGYFNDVEILGEGRAKSGIIAIMLPGLVESGKLMFRNISYLSDHEREYLSQHEYSQGECTVVRMLGPWRELQDDGTLIETNELAKRTYAIMDTRDVPRQQQVHCSAGGMLINSIPNDEDIDTVRNALRSLTTNKLVKGLITGELTPKSLAIK